jgi:hypothetical protein
MVSGHEQVSVLQPGQCVHLEIRGTSQREFLRRSPFKGRNREPYTPHHSGQGTDTCYGMTGTGEEITAGRGFLTDRKGIRGLLLIALRGRRVYFPFENRGLAQNGINIEAVEMRVNRKARRKV